MQRKVSYLKNGIRLLSAGSLCFSIAFPFAVSGQTDTAKKLDQVNVNAKALPGIPSLAPVQQIAASAFDQLSAFNVADAIRDFAGVNIKDYGGIGGLKTVSVRSLGADHLAVLYDGVQINDAENGEIDLGRLNLDNIESIALYNGQPPELCMPARSFASASVLSIVPAHPNLTAAKPYLILLGLKGGSFGLINPYLQWQQRLNSNWTFIVNSYWEKANGQYKYKVNGDGSDTSSTRKNADINAQEADGALYYAKGDSDKFNLHINFYNSDRGLPGAVIFYNPESNQRLWNTDVFLQSGYERLWRQRLHLLINAKLSQDYTHYIDPDFLNNDGGLDDRYKQREFYQSTALSYLLLPKLEISFANDISFNGLDANLYNYAYPTRFTLLDVLASSYRLGKWHFEGNLLHTYVYEWVKTGSAAPARSIYSPTLMASFQPTGSPNLQLRAFYKDIFRNPTFDEQYYFAVDGSRSVKPEFTKQFDLGITYQKALNTFLDYVSLTVDGYYNNVTDKIVALPNQNEEISSIINLGKVAIKGVDAGVKTQTKLDEGWRGSLSVNYTYQDAIDVTNPTSSYYRQQIPYTPKSTLSLNFGVDYKALGLYYNQVLSSSRYYLSENLPANLVDGYSVSDVALICKFKAGGKPVVLSGHIENLFDENYVIVRSFPMPGRSFLLSCQIKI